MGFVEWDDGNLVNEDGCNEECKVETDWECTGGDASNPDRCISLIGPKCEFTYVSSTSYLGSIAFTENVTLGNLNDGDLEITISGPLSPYEFNYYLNESTGYTVGKVTDKFKIQFEFLSSLAGYNKGRVPLHSL